MILQQCLVLQRQITDIVEYNPGQDKWNDMKTTDGQARVITLNSDTEPDGNTPGVHVTWCNPSSVCRLSINTQARVCASSSITLISSLQIEACACAQHDGWRCLVCQWLRWVICCKLVDWLIVFDTDNCLIGLISTRITGLVVWYSGRRFNLFSN